MTKKQKIAYYILLVMVSLIFIMASLSKLTSQPSAIAGFSVAHLPIWFMYFIGVAELAGVIGLWLRGASPRFSQLRQWAASGLLIILAGAVVTTAAFVSVAEAFFPLVVGIIIGCIMRLDKKVIKIAYKAN